MALFPIRRPRRLRVSPAMRSLVRETRLGVDDLIYPLFVVPGRDVTSAIPSMPGVSHFSVDQVIPEIDEVTRLGVSAIILFGLPETKDEVGSGAYAADGIVQRAIRAIKDHRPDMLVITDVCMCEYTSHGHCGVIVNGQVDNDRSLDLIARTALSHAVAGADIVAPSDMMDGRVGAIRTALDQNGYQNTAIMAYSAKYASAFYGPFRDAADSAPQFGDRTGYQMDPANVREALLEVEQDIAEGADIVMVKPALAFLDVIARVRDRVQLPLCAYNVSGEYAMLKAAAANGWLDERRATLEALTSIRRAGADMIITYHAKDVARWLAGE